MTRGPQKRVLDEKTDSERKKGWSWSRISTPVKVLSIVVTCLIGLFVFLYSQQRDLWQQRLDTAREQANRSQQQGEKKSEQPEKKQVLKGPEVGSGVPFQVTVQKSEPSNVGENLTITLTEITREPDSAKYRVTAKVFLKGEDEMQIRNAEEGYIVTYPKEHGYKFELLKADANSAKFRIVKNP